MGLVLDVEDESFFEADVTDRIYVAGLAAGQGGGAGQEGVIEGKDEGDRELLENHF